MIRWCLAALAMVLAVTVLYAVRPARATFDVETITVIDDTEAGTTTLRTEDFNKLVLVYNLMLREKVTRCSLLVAGNP